MECIRGNETTVAIGWDENEIQIKAKDCHYRCKELGRVLPRCLNESGIDCRLVVVKGQEVLFQAGDQSRISF